MSLYLFKNLENLIFSINDIESVNNIFDINNINEEIMKINKLQDRSG